MAFLARIWQLLIVTPARLAALVILLALLSTIPILQWIALGFLLDVTGRLGRGERLAECFSILDPAGRAGLALLAIVLLSQPIDLFAYYAEVAEIISPANPRRFLFLACGWLIVFAAIPYLAWTWIRGGRLVHYLWPQPLRLLREGWRPRTWKGASDRFWHWIQQFHLPALWWLGVRGGLGVLAWLVIPASLLIFTSRRGETGLAGLVGSLSFLLMGGIILYLPLLQTNMAAEQAWRAIFNIRTARSAFRAAPLVTWIATSSTLLLALPLYLLKIEATPKEVVWLPAIVFILFMLPAHVISGLAWRRARTRTPARGMLATLFRLCLRVALIPVVFLYMFVVYLSQLTSWDGLRTWFEQHAFLLPIPFIGV